MKLINKLKDNYIAKKKYIKYVKSCNLNSNYILLESQQGKEFGGNIYYIVQELLTNPQFSQFRVFICVNKTKIKDAEIFYKNKKLSKINIVECNTRKYYKLMATCKYLVSDNTFLPFFVKKEGQIYLNTWHGTPLKSLGKKINNDFHNIGNAQKNFVASDFLLYPNEYTKNHMIEDYMLENLCKSTCLIHGYPRNTAFFNEDLKQEIISKYGLEGKKIITYMPTWRGSLGNKRNPITQANINYVLEEFETRLKEDQIAYVNLHPIESASVDFSKYNKVKPFPNEYETYEFLNVANVLVTDYSSVFFDFLNTEKKIILYTYDKEDYLSSRGVYRSLENFPFPIVETFEEVIKEINTPKSYDDSVLREEFCKWDNCDVTRKLCERVFLGMSDTGIQEDVVKDNGKENVFIFVGRLASNGITASLKNLINNLDREKRNYYLLFSTKDVKNNLDTLKELSSKVNYYCYKGRRNLTLFQTLIFIIYQSRWIKTETYLKLMNDANDFELKRIFSTARVDSLVHFTGYSDRIINLFSAFKKNKVIYVHANMLEEINLKKNQRFDALEYAYKKYDKVAIVTDDIFEPTLAISNREDNIHVCHNIIDYETILRRSKLNLEILEQTEIFPNQAQLSYFLESADAKFINVGRFSPEKGQMRLLEAFAKIVNKYPNTKMIIIGGASYKDYYQQIINHVEQLNLRENVVLIKNLPNPFPVVKKCDYSILSSFAEGFGLVLAEADVLGKPVVSVDIPGPRNFLKRYGGMLVENTEDGLFEGMERCLSGKVNVMGVDYAMYNQQALNEFDALFSNND